MGANLVHGDKLVGATIILFEILICAIVLAVTILLWKRRSLYYHYYTSKIPGPSFRSLMKNAIDLSLGKTSGFEILQKYLDKYKNLFTILLGSKVAYVITKPDDIQIILNKALHKDSLYEVFRQAVDLSLFTAPVEHWKPRRKIIMSTFNQKVLNSFVGVFSEQTDILVKRLEEYSGKGCFDVHPFLILCTLDSISETANGSKINAQTERGHYANWLIRGLEIINYRIFHVWFHSDLAWRLNSLSWELDELITNMKEVVRKAVILKKQKYRETKDTISIDNSSEGIRKTKAFMDYLIELSEEGANFTDEELVNEVSMMAIAGTDTSGSVIGFTLVMLGIYTNIQNKAHEEQYEIFGNNDREVTPEDLSHMAYLERVIKETLRLFPPGVLFSRFLHEDIELGSCTIPKDATCVIVPFHTHRDPEFWPDPLRYDPDRFLSEEVDKRHPYSFIPFSAGPRNCIGINYAMMVMKTILSGIIRRYKVSTSFKSITDIKLDMKMTMKSLDGYKIALQDRLVKDV